MRRAGAGRRPELCRAISPASPRPAARAAICLTSACRTTVPICRRRSQRPSPRRSCSRIASCSRPSSHGSRLASSVPGAASGSWAEVYGPYADEYFHAYSIASYIEVLAKAGRAVYDLPMYGQRVRFKFEGSGANAGKPLLAPHPLHCRFGSVLRRLRLPFLFCGAALRRLADRLSRPKELTLNSQKLQLSLTS
jgi:hypothetical protein